MEATVGITRVLWSLMHPQSNPAREDGYHWFHFTDGTIKTQINYSIENGLGRHWLETKDAALPFGILAVSANVGFATLGTGTRNVIWA